jgi:Icc protein
MTDRITRREFAVVSAAGAAGLVLSSTVAPAAAVQTARPARKRVLRFAHMTDVHVQPEKGAAEGMAAALRHAQGLDDPIEFVVTGGDAVMDAFGADAARTKTQWNIWKSVLRDECSVPVAHCIGNHDIWGWAKSSSGTSGDEPGWGKQSAIDNFGIPDRYYSVLRAGWKFIMLDSTRSDGEGYLAYLDDAQHDWLVRELRDTDPSTPIVIVSHIPILTVTAQIYDKKRVSENATHLPGGWVHLDALRLKNLFRKHPNVRLCLSGHMHLIDHVVYNDAHHICDGAVSGAWWGGDNQECDEGYGVVDLFDDGSFEHRYIAYNWNPRE